MQPCFGVLLTVWLCTWNLCRHLAGTCTVGRDLRSRVRQTLQVTQRISLFYVVHTPAMPRCGRTIPKCHHDDKRLLPPEIISRWMPLLFRSFVCVVMATGDSRVRGHAVDPRELRDASVNVVYTEEDAGIRCRMNNEGCWDLHWS